MISVRGKPKACSLLDSLLDQPVEKRGRGEGMERREEGEEETAFVSTSGELLPFIRHFFSFPPTSLVLTFSPQLSFLFLVGRLTDAGRVRYFLAATAETRLETFPGVISRRLPTFSIRDATPVSFSNGERRA